MAFQKSERKPVSSPISIEVMTKEGLVQSQVALGHTLPPFPIDRPREALALYLGNEVLGLGFKSRLLMEIREKLGLTYSISSRFLLRRDDYGIFNVGTFTKTDETSRILRETLRVLKDFYEGGISEEELESAKLEAKGDFRNQIQTREGEASTYFYYVEYLGLDKSFLKNYLSYIDQISVDEVHQAVKKYLDLNRLKVVIYGDPALKTLLEKDGFSFDEVEFSSEYASEI